MVYQQVLTGCFLSVAVGCCMIDLACSKEWTKEEKEQMMDAVKACTESTKIDQKELDAMMKDHSMPASQEGKCFIKCMSEKMDGMRPDGSIDPVGTKAWMDENVSDQATREKMDAAIKECIAAGEIGSDACETAAKNIECMQKKFKEAGITSSMIMS